jgi:hypothetical protein
VNGVEAVLHFAQAWIEALEVSPDHTPTIDRVLVKAKAELALTARAADRPIANHEVRDGLRRTFRWCALVANMQEEALP